MKSVDKKVGDVVYYKYKINLPKKIETTDLLNRELLITITDNKIIIEKDFKKNKK